MVMVEIARVAIWLASLFLLASTRGINGSEPEGTRVAEMPLAVTSSADAVSPLEMPVLDMLKDVAISEPQKRHIRRLLDAQESYDFNAELSTVDILVRSGFYYELHNCTSVDGYQTELVRIVNPLVDRKHLRQIPVVLYTGQGTSPAAFLAASLGSQRPARWVPDDEYHDHHQHQHHQHHQHQTEQHHHETLPLEYRDAHHSQAYSHEPHALDGQHEGHHQHSEEEEQEQEKEHHYHDRQQRRKRGADSLLQLDVHLLAENNRSLAVVLANHGYDVWLVPSRGVDKQNRRRMESSRSVKQILENKLTLLKNMLHEKPAIIGSSKTEEVADSMPLVAKLRNFVKSFTSHDYWSFSSDEIIEFELEIQLERVRLETKREKLSLITYSNGGFITFAFLASHPGYALKHLDAIINLAPAVYVNKLNLAYGVSNLLSHMAPSNSAFPNEHLHGFARTAFVQLCRGKVVRYSLCKLLLDGLYGPSDHMYRTHLELGLFDYIGRPQSARGLRQTLQAAHEGKLIHYDHGLLGNLLFYEQLTAPEYELRRVDHPRVYVLAGERDSIVDESSLEKLTHQLGTKPAKIIKIPGYNHLDLLAAYDNSLRVNTPILQILNDRYLELDYYLEEEGKFGVENLVRDIEHNRLNANDTGHMPDYSHYHVNSEHNHPHDQVEAGFKVDESGVVNDEFDSVSSAAHRGNETSHHHHQGQLELPAGRLSPGAAASAFMNEDSPVDIQHQHQAIVVSAPWPAQDAQAHQVTLAQPQQANPQTSQEAEHADTAAGAKQLLDEKHARSDHESMKQHESHGHDQHVEAIEPSETA